jgi:hypothetical protein
MESNKSLDAVEKAIRDVGSDMMAHRRLLSEKEEKELKKLIKDFANFDESSLFKKSNKELAEFQSEHMPLSPQYGIGQNEWNRRLIVQQMRNARFSAYIGVFGTILGVIVGALLSWYLAGL